MLETIVSNEDRDASEGHIYTSTGVRSALWSDNGVVLLFTLRCLVLCFIGKAEESQCFDKVRQGMPSLRPRIAVPGWPGLLTEENTSSR